MSFQCSLAIRNIPRAHLRSEKGRQNLHFFPPFFVFFFKKNSASSSLSFSLSLLLFNHQKQNLLAIGLVAILITYHYLVAEPLPV